MVHPKILGVGDGSREHHQNRRPVAHLQILERKRLMRERRAIVTMTIGESWAPVASISHPTFRAYADRVGADFLVIDRRRISSSEHIHWEKLQLERLIAPYHRALYLDTDALVHPNAKNLFELVPRGKFAAWAEGDEMDRNADVEGVCRFYDRPMFDSKAFFNAGVFLVEREHRWIFRAPPRFYRGENPEQAYLNMVAAALPRFPLDREWDLFHGFKKPGESCSIIHFAALSKSIADLTEKMAAELATWGAA
jgi:lipopolysaccharide biosynthesis glycosyltransferase